MKVGPEAILTASLLCAMLGLVEGLLYFTTRGMEPPGFRVFPKTASGWRGYGLRMLIVVNVASLMRANLIVFDPVAFDAWMVSAGLLLVCSIVFSRLEPRLSKICLAIWCFYLVYGLLFPALGSPKER